MLMPLVDDRWPELLEDNFDRLGALVEFLLDALCRDVQFSLRFLLVGHFGLACRPAGFDF